MKDCDLIVKVYTLDVSLWLPRTPDEVFPFFSNAHNLERITPPWVKFRVLTPEPILIQRGTTLDYQLRLRGIPVRWQSEITEWEPPYRFTDKQTRGPYRLWIHEHTFEAKGGGVIASDRVRYAVWGGALVDRLLVAPDLQRIFAFRQQELTRHFA